MLKRSCLILALILLLTMQAAYADNAIPAGANAAEMFFAARSDRINYADTYGSVDTSYIIDNGDGTISAVTAYGDSVNIETYDENYNLIDKKSIEYELPVFGAFYAGEKNNYIVFGLNGTNETKDSEREVVRVVRYDKDFNRTGSISHNRGRVSAIEPFHAGSARLSEYGNTLVLHMAKLRTIGAGGLNHQSCYVAVMNSDTMEYLGQPVIEVSHSFDQYVSVNENGITFADHGDAGPRAIYVVNYKPNLAMLADYRWSSLDKINQGDLVEHKIFDIPGKSGENFTGVSLGGMLTMNDRCVVAINSIYSEYGTKTKDSKRDIYILTTPLTLRKTLKEQYDLTKYEGYLSITFDTENETAQYSVLKNNQTVVVATVPMNPGETQQEFQKRMNEKPKPEPDTNLCIKYSGTDRRGSVPKLVAVSDDEFVMLWEEYNESDDTYCVRYVKMNSKGKVIGKAAKAEGYRMSTCAPIYSGGKIMWFANNVGKSLQRVFYAIDI